MTGVQTCALPISAYGEDDTGTAYAEEAGADAEYTEEEDTDEEMSYDGENL